MQLHHVASKQSTSGHMIITVNVVFVLKAEVSTSVNDSYLELAKQLTVAIGHEERRCQYLSLQAKIMMAANDEVAALPEDCLVSPYKLILERSQLAQELKKVYDSVLATGIVQFHMNKWVEINFCLPHKIHTIQLGTKLLHIEPEVIHRCLAALRPYHGMLLMVEKQTILDSLPIDCAPTLTRLIKMASPVKSLQTLSLDADLNLSQVFQLVCHLVYWAKATVIYPLCETNVYVLSPQANTLVNSPLVEEFTEHFPGRSLHVEMSEFSLPSYLRENRNIPQRSDHQAQRVQLVVWMLQHRLLLQLHTYIFLVPQKPAAAPSQSDEDVVKAKVQVVEESVLSVLMEDMGLRITSSISDAASVNSDESVGPTGSMQLNMLSKSPSVGEMASDGTVITEETKAQWRLQDSLLNSLTPDVKAAILKCPAARNVEDLKLFARLSPYFNGKHHLEEIMFYENITRSHLLTLLDKFKDVLMTCNHQDPATEFYAG
ncbi:GATOR complex protein NPRL3-like isoform X2 [Gigantopelta aegis]|nr:GATOR complex protein NPRL3-like isoform X2 [Gigantopelta aegis]